MRPDIAFTRRRLAVFIDGCFWHGCPDHGTTPRSNTHYWGPKLARNVERENITNAIERVSDSIVAKVIRDRLMDRLAERHPHYGWEHNAGYATLDHRRGIEEHGITAVVINRRPEFSGPLNREIDAAPAARFPQSDEAGRFLVRWRL